jgi:hypothetical protein
MYHPPSMPGIYNDTLLTINLASLQEQLVKFLILQRNRRFKGDPFFPLKRLLKVVEKLDEGTGSMEPSNREGRPLICKALSLKGILIIPNYASRVTAVFER